MTTVNVWHIGNLLGGLIGAADDERIAAIPEDDKASLRKLFADRLAPAYRRLRPHGQTLFKESLRYFLNVRSPKVGDMIAAMQDVPLSKLRKWLDLAERFFGPTSPTAKVYRAELRRRQQITHASARKGGSHVR